MHLACCMRHALNPSPPSPSLLILRLSLHTGETSNAEGERAHGHGHGHERHLYVAKSTRSCFSHSVSAGLTLYQCSSTPSSFLSCTTPRVHLRFAVEREDKLSPAPSPTPSTRTSLPRAGSFPPPKCVAPGAAIRPVPLPAAGSSSCNGSLRVCASHKLCRAQRMNSLARPPLQ